MKNLLLIITLLLSGCASTSNKKVQDLEDKINKLTELLEKKEKSNNTEKDEKKNTKKEEKIEIVSPDLKILIPKVNEKKNDGKTRKMSLGKKDNIDFNLFFNNTTYWIVLSPINDKADIVGEIVLNIEHENKSPESLSFFPIREGIYKSLGEPLHGLVNLEIKFSRENKKTIVFKIEANL